jgi:hypothetical protein
MTDDGNPVACPGKSRQEKNIKTDIGCSPLRPSYKEKEILI